MRWIALSMAAMLTAGAWGDVVHLNDGSKLEGTIKRDQGGWQITDPKGKVTFIADDRIESIEKGTGRGTADAADAGLASLRRAADNLSDLSQIIDRFTKFIDQNKGFPAANEAAKDLANWKDRKAKNMVKVGASWVTAEERAALIEKTMSIVEQARAQIKSGRMRDAAGTVDQLLSIDPANVSALYLRGLLDAKQDQPAIARKSWDKVREMVPDHGPTLNNLAVIMWSREKMGAIALYDLAMAGSPVNRQILDNTAEALNAIPEKDREHTTYKRALKRFNDQDAELQKKMAEEGLYRWGATFVTKEQREELKKAEEKIKGQVDEVKKEYEKVSDKVADNDRTIEINTRQIDRIRRDSFRTDVDGRVLQLPLPGVYYELRRDNEKLKSDQSKLMDDLEKLKAKAKKIQQNLPIPQFTGAQRLIEAEGTPIAIPAPKAGVNPAKPAANPLVKPPAPPADPKLPPKRDAGVFEK